GFVPINVGGDLLRAAGERAHKPRELLDLPVGVKCVAVRGPRGGKSGSQAMAAWPMPLIAFMESRTATVSRPRHFPAANTRALICRCRCRCGSPALDV